MARAPRTRRHAPDLTSPTPALLLALVAVVCELLAFYAREQLPSKVADGRPLDRFDRITGALPLIDGAAGPAVGALLALAALGLVAYGVSQRRVPEPVLAAATVGLALVALVAPTVLDTLVGA